LPRLRQNIAASGRAKDLADLENTRLGLELDLGVAFCGSL
jgi:hypothetical protein